MIRCRSFLEARLTAIEVFASDSEIVSIRIFYEDGYWYVDRKDSYEMNDKETLKAIEKELI